MGSKAPNIRILTVRDQNVVVDSDLAAVYGVTTKRLDEQFRRNRKRFPEDFAFQLTVEEFEALGSQIAILDEDTRKGAGSKRSQNTTTSSSSLAMSSQIATTSRQRRRKTHRPWTFTEHGALQVANILRSNRAIAMSVYVIRAFIELRQRVATNTTILKRLAEIDKALLEHDTALRDTTRNYCHSLHLHRNQRAGKSDFPRDYTMRAHGDRRDIVLAAAVAASFAGSGCHSKLAGKSDTPLRIIATDAGFDAPDKVSVGFRHIVFENRGPRDS